MDRVVEIREFILQIEREAAAPSDDAGPFHDLIRRGFDLMVLTDANVAEHFAMSRTSIMRWRNGRTAPHPAMRRHVYAWLLRTAKLCLQTVKKEPEVAPCPLCYVGQFPPSHGTMTAGRLCVECYEFLTWGGHGSESPESV